MDDQDEIIDQLARLSRRLDYLTTIALCVLGIAFGGVVYFFLKEPAGEYYAVLAAILAAWALPLSHGDLVSARRFLIDIMLKDPLVAKRRLRRPPDGVAREKRPEGGGWANKNCDTARS